MRSLTWLRTDPRGKLVISVLLFLALVLALTAGGVDSATAGRSLGLFYLLPVLVPVNGIVLRQRHRSLRWLLFHIVGLGLVPVLVALLARPGRQA